MPGLKATTAALSRMRRELAKARPGDRPATASILRETRSFGSNPGGLRMLTYAPKALPPAPPLVVVLHGCTQSGEGYVRGAGWATLADRLGFVVLAPEQTAASNSNRCFRWWEPDQVRRGSGEVASIRQMIERARRDHGIDPSRIFVTGLSAGGAMTAAMLATYPEVFAGGAIIAGLPFDSANGLQQAFGSMFQGPSRPASEWGDRVRAASPHAGPWPRVSIWHGDDDAMVIPKNALESVKQWTDVHGLTQAAPQAAIDGRRTHQVWRDAAGRPVVETHAIAGLGHGTPIALSEGLGAAEAHFLEAGVSSTLEIARFWGLEAAADREVRPAAKPTEARTDQPRPRRQPEPTPAPAPAPAFTVEGVINDALRAAGLLR